MEKIKVSEIREKFPMYGDLNDDQLLIALRKKYYSDIPPARFYGNIDYDTERERLNKDLVGSMSTTDKLLAGAGKSFNDLMTTGQMAGAALMDFVSPREKKLSNLVTGQGPKSRYQEIKEQAQEDARLSQPLMDTSAGAWGKGLTDAGLTFVPGLGAANKIRQGVQATGRLLPKASGVLNAVAPYVGAAGSGGIIGAITSPDDMSGGATTGALAGTAGEAGGRVLSAAYSGAKAAVEPLWQSGRERILKRTLDRFATDPNKVRAAAQNPVEYVAGVKPTLAEATMDPGIAQLQRGAAASSPDVASALAEARGRQFAGYKGVLDDLAGNDGRMEFFTSARNAAADDLYGQARAAGLTSSKALDAQAGQLMKKPVIQEAIVEARRKALNEGVDIGDPSGSVKGMQYIVRAIDDKISAAGVDDKRVLMNVKDEILGYLEQASPKFMEARDTFKQMSRPINQMNVAQKLRDTALPALTDFSEGSLARVNANSYANALRNADRTARQATGLKGATMESVMDPAQMAQINGIGQDMARYAGAQELARVPGSPTAQYLGAQNVVRQFLGPLGIPQSAADSMVGRLVSGVMGFPFKMTQSQTEQLLARALTDPATAAKILAAKDPKTIVEILRPYAAQTAIQMDTQ
jgi:hypothetical protein